MNQVLKTVKCGMVNLWEKSLKNLFFLTRPPLLFLGILASVSLLNFSGNLFTVKGLLVVISISCVNAGFNVMNEWKDRFDDTLKKGKKVYATKLPESLITNMITILIYTGTLTTIILGILFNPIYIIIGLIAGLCGITYNYLRRRDFFGNLALGGVYGSAAWMCLHPHYVNFIVGFSLWVIGFNILVQAQDMEKEEVYTFPKQFGREKSCFTAGAIILPLSFFFFITSLPIFVFPALVVWTGFVIWIFRGDIEIFEYSNRILGRLALIFCFIYILI